MDSTTALELLHSKPDGDVRVENLVIKVKRGARSLGIKAWGAVDYLVSQRGYKLWRVKEL